MSMKQTMWRLPAVLLLAVMVVLTVNSVAHGWGEPPAKVGIFEPVKRPVEPGPVDVLFRFAPPEGYEGDSVFHVTATAREAGIYTGRRNWTITASPDQPHEEVLTVIVAPDTISALTLNVMGKDYHWFPSAYFIERGDSLEFWNSYPRPPEVPADQTQKLDDSLDFQFTIANEEQLTEVLQILTALPDSALGKPITTRATLREMVKISHLGIRVKNLDINRTDDPSKAGKGYWIIEPKQPESDTGTKSTPGNSDNGDRISPQGSLNSERDDRYPAVCIDTVIPMVDGGTVLASDAVHHA